MKTSVVIKEIFKTYNEAEMYCAVFTIFKKRI